MSHEWDCRCPRCEADEAKYTGDDPRTDDAQARYESGGERSDDDD